MCSLIIHVVHRNLMLVRVSVQSDHTGHAEKLRLVRISVHADHTCRTDKPQDSTSIIHAIQRNLRYVRVSYMSYRVISG